MTELKKWVGLGLGTALLGSTLSACGDNARNGSQDPSNPGQMAEATPAQSQLSTASAASQSPSESAGYAGEGEGGEGEGGEGGAGMSMDALPAPKRLAFMSGHVEAGLALYRAGYPELAARHLLHPVSETHAAEREGLDRLGFTPDVFVEVSDALDQGRPASEIEPQLRAAENNLQSMADQAGGSPADIIRYLMDVTVEEYNLGVEGGEIVNAPEYQDAYGFVITARKRAQALPAAERDRVTAALDELVSMWPDGAPLSPDNPAPAAQISALASRVNLALPNG